MTFAPLFCITILTIFYLVFSSGQLKKTDIKEKVFEKNDRAVSIVTKY